MNTNTLAIIAVVVAGVCLLAALLAGLGERKARTMARGLGLTAVQEAAAAPPWSVVLGAFALIGIGIFLVFFNGVDRSPAASAAVVRIDGRECGTELIVQREAAANEPLPVDVYSGCRSVLDGTSLSQSGTPVSNGTLLRSPATPTPTAVPTPAPSENRAPVAIPSATMVPKPTATPGDALVATRYTHTDADGLKRWYVAAPQAGTGTLHFDAVLSGSEGRLVASHRIAIAKGQRNDDRDTTPFDNGDCAGTLRFPKAVVDAEVYPVDVVVAKGNCGDRVTVYVNGDAAPSAAMATSFREKQTLVERRLVKAAGTEQYVDVVVAGDGVSLLQASTQLRAPVTLSGALNNVPNFIKEITGFLTAFGGAIVALFALFKVLKPS